jgi:CheY-like chemotaxis protein
VTNGRRNFRRKKWSGSGGAATNEHADCILMDLQMPEMDGIEATTTIRIQKKESHKTRSTYIAALTVNIVPADRQRRFDVGRNHYLNKPIQFTVLAAMLIAAADFAGSAK